MSHALIPLGSVHPPVLQPFGFQWLVSASRHASLLSNPLLSPSVVPSDGMIAIADICRLSWWSCMKTNDGRSRRRLSKVQWHDAGKSSNEQKGCNGEKKWNERRQDRLEEWRGREEKRNRKERTVESRFRFRWSHNCVTSTVHLSSWGFLSNPLRLVSPQAFYGKCQCFRSNRRPLTALLLYSDAFTLLFQLMFCHHSPGIVVLNEKNENKQSDSKRMQLFSIYFNCKKMSKGFYWYFLKSTLKQRK